MNKREIMAEIVGRLASAGKDVGKLQYDDYMNEIEAVADQIIDRTPECEPRLVITGKTGYMVTASMLEELS